MSNLTLKLEPMAGSHMQDVAHEMQRVADKLVVRVEAQFNDVHMIAVVGGSGEWLALNTLTAMDEISEHRRWAFSHHDPDHKRRVARARAEGR